MTPGDVMEVSKRIVAALALVVLVGVAVSRLTHTPNPPAAPGALVGAPPALICPAGCEMDVAPLPGSRLRAMCWCDTPGGAAP